jgi:hypothetical protein
MTNLIFRKRVDIKGLSLEQSLAVTEALQGLSDYANSLEAKLNEAQEKLDQLDIAAAIRRKRLCGH